VKRILAVLLACLLLCSCGAVQPEPTEPTTTATEPTTLATGPVVAEEEDERRPFDFEDVYRINARLSSQHVLFVADYVELVPASWYYVAVSRSGRAVDIWFYDHEPDMCMDDFFVAIPDDSAFFRVIVLLDSGSYEYDEEENEAVQIVKTLSEALLAAPAMIGYIDFLSVDVIKTPREINIGDSAKTVFSEYPFGSDGYSIGNQLGAQIYGYGYVNYDGYEEPNIPLDFYGMSVRLIDYNFYVHYWLDYHVDESDIITAIYYHATYFTEGE